MIHFEYNNKRHWLLTGWDEITLEKAIEVMEVVDLFPDNLKALYKIAMDESQTEEAERLLAALSDKENHKIIPGLYARIITLLSNVEAEDIKYWNELEIRAMYLDYVINNIYGLMLLPLDYKVQRIEKFNHNGKDYYFPESRQILGNDKPLSNTTALEFTEVADLELNAKQLKAGKLEVAANIVAILCRPLGEEYDEQTSLDRAPEFLTLPMSIVWEVFFYILEPLTLSTQRNQISLMEAAIAAGKQQKAAG